MLNVQKYLRNGGTLDQLQQDLSIELRFDPFLGVVCLNYNQIASPMGNPIVQECRALVLEVGTWDVQSYSFPKFFNLGEGHVPSNFNWSDFRTYEKLDGSLIHFWYHAIHGWQVGTRSIPAANVPLDDTGLTFRQLVERAVKDMGYLSLEDFTKGMDINYTHVFELTGPENQVVVPYKDRRLTLLAVRDRRDLQEHDPAAFLPAIGGSLQVVRRFDGFSLEAVQKRCAEIHPSEQEGFVLVDDQYNRVKVKSPAYCLLSHMRDGLGKSNRSRLELILTNKDDDVVGMLPPSIMERIRTLKARLLTVSAQIDAEYLQICSEMPEGHTQKDFALRVLKASHQAPHFMRRQGKILSGLQYFQSITSRAALDALRIKDEDPVVEGSATE